MIVPQNRLLFWVAVLVLPFAALGTAVPAAAGLALALIAGLVIVAAADAVLVADALRGVRIELPEVVRLTKDRAGAIEVRIHNDRQRPIRLRLGLAFPREIEPATEDLQTRLPAASPLARLAWPCTPRRRGVYALHRCHAETLSPLGFWARRATLPARTELRAYPNLLGARRHLAALFLRRGNFGMHAHRQVGQGREFEKLRDYLRGDGLADIHWKATAKRRRPVTKVYQIERTQEVYVVVDASRLSARRGAAAGDTVLERFITAALVLGLVAEQQGDLFGVLSFAHGVRSFVRAKRGQAHYHACRDALYTLEPQLVTPDFGNLASFLRLRLRRRALLFFLTSLDDPVLAEAFTRSVELICHQHLVLVGMARPAGAGPLFAPGPAATVDDLYRNLGGHLQWHDLRELERVLQHRGVRLAQLDNDQMAVQLVTHYINVKRRQLL